jgi:hypothetical protein
MLLARGLVVDQIRGEPCERAFLPALQGGWRRGFSGAERAVRRRLGAPYIRMHGRARGGPLYKDAVVRRSAWNGRPSSRCGRHGLSVPPGAGLRWRSACRHARGVMPLPGSWPAPGHQPELGFRRNERACPERGPAPPLRLPREPVAGTTGATLNLRAVRTRFAKPGLRPARNRPGTSVPSSHSRHRVLGLGARRNEGSFRPTRATGSSDRGGAGMKVPSVPLAAAPSPAGSAVERAFLPVSPTARHMNSGRRSSPPRQQAPVWNEGSFRPADPPGPAGEPPASPPLAAPAWNEGSFRPGSPQGRRSARASPPHHERRWSGLREWSA